MAAPMICSVIPLSLSRSSTANSESAYNSAISAFSAVKWLRVQPVQCPRKRNRLPHMLQPADPRHHALDSHAKPAVRHATVLAQVEIPLERLFWQPILPNSREQQIIT